MLSDPCIPPPGGPPPLVGPGSGSGTVGPPGAVSAGGGSATAAPGGCAAETCRFPKLEECAHFHYERVQLPQLDVVLKEDMEVSLHSQHALTSSPDTTYYTLQVTCRDECWLIQRSLDNFAMLDAQLHQCIYDRKVSQLLDLQEVKERKEQRERKRRRSKSEGSVREDDDYDGDGENLESTLSHYLHRLSAITNNSLNCGPVLNWFQLDNRGHRLLVPSEESRSINTPAVAAAYSVRRYVSQARDELSLEVGDMISVIDMASPGESVWWRGKRGFQVGFFPQYCVHIIGDKVPRNMPLPPPVVGSLAISPIKPVLRKHGKLITFFRSFILNRPSRRRLKQSGILKERVFGCDLGEHLLNSGHDIPMVLKCCAEFIESHGIVDGIYRLSGVTSNIQKLRNAFDEDRIPNLYTDDILQDIHSVASLLKMYFRELPNPLCTYQLYHSFVSAVQGCSASRNKANDNERLLKMREAVQKLPPPHYRTLEYLMRHLQLISTHGHNTGMTTRNLAIVWAPNLLRCEELEIGGVAALQGVGVQAVVTEFLVCYADLIFSEKVPVETVSQSSNQESSTYNSHDSKLNINSDEKRSRPKSLAISTPTKLLTLEEARNKHLLMKDEGSYIEVGGGPKSLPKKYHTVIELPAGSRKRGLAKRSPSGWRSFFSKSRNSSHGNLSKNRDISSPGIVPIDKSVTESDLNDIKRKLRPVKSAESLTSGQSEPANCEGDVLGPLHCLSKPPGHNRSVSHDSYFDNLQSSQNNSVGSLLDLSEIQLNFELEESEMRIFSEDESLVSSPKVQKEVATRKSLNRARPEDFSSAANSSNPSPKKQPRVVISPDSLSRKRSRLEDQLSDIQYIDCSTPDHNLPCLISTTALIHNDDSGSITNLNPAGGTAQLFEGYQPKNKSPRNSENNRHSLNFEKIDKMGIPKSLTDVDLKKTQNSLSFNLTPTPGTPNYKPLNETSSTTTPNTSPDLRNHENFENLNSPKYENILTTISITYKSPIKSRNNSENIYEDIELNPEKAVVPTTVASLPIQEASQPILELSDSSHSKSPRLSLETTFDSSITTICSGDSATLKDEIPLDLGEKEPTRPCDLKFSAKTEPMEKSFDSTSKSLELTTTYKSIDSFSSTPNTPNNSKKSLITPTDEMSTSENPNSSTSSNLSSNCQLTDDLTEGRTVESTLSDSLSAAESSLKKVTNNNDKRKSCDAELLDENAIYQQVKYFRRSIHEINTLLDLEIEEKSSKSVNSSVEDITSKLEENSDKYSEIEAKEESNKIVRLEPKCTNEENFDSLEENHVQLYENVEPNRNLDLSRTRMHESSPKKLDLSSIEEIAVCSKCSEPEITKKSNVKNLTSKFETKDRNEESNLPMKKYDKDGLPPCLRAKNAKNSIKTRSLDENAFVTEFGHSSSLQRRKSLDDRTSSYINSKILTESSKTSASTTDIRSESQKNVKNNLEPLTVVTEKLNRERIEKYKEERRNFWREKYRSESFKEDKEILLSRLKQKSFNKSRNEEDSFLLSKLQNEDSRLSRHSKNQEPKEENCLSATKIQNEDIAPRLSFKSIKNEDTKSQHDDVSSRLSRSPKHELFGQSKEEISKSKEGNRNQNEDPSSRLSFKSHHDDVALRLSRSPKHEIFGQSKEDLNTTKNDDLSSRLSFKSMKNDEIKSQHDDVSSRLSRSPKHELFGQSKEENCLNTTKSQNEDLSSRLSFKSNKNEDTKSQHEDISSRLSRSPKHELFGQSKEENRQNEEFSSRLSFKSTKNDETKSQHDDLSSKLSRSPKHELFGQPKEENRQNEDLSSRLSFKSIKNDDTKSQHDDISSRLSRSPKHELFGQQKEEISRQPKEDFASRLSNLKSREESDNQTTKKLPMEALSKFEGAVTKLRKKNSPLLERKTRPSLKELSDKILDESTDEATILHRGGKEEDFLRHRRGDSESERMEKSERRRHTYDLLREREFEAEGPKRGSLDAKNPRKEKCSPSYCIKDMKAIFESKSQQ